MSYQEKYLKYKNKYLALKSKYGHLLNNSTEESSAMPIRNNEPTVPVKMLNDLNESEEAPSTLNVNVVNLVGGAKSSEPVPETETETTINNDNNSDTLSSLFNQAGGKGPKKSGKKAKRHFFSDKSDSDLSSSSTMSEAASDSEFSSSEIDW